MHLLRERFSFVAITSIVLAAFGCGGSAGTGDESVDSNEQAVETVPQCNMEGCDEPGGGEPTPTDPTCPPGQHWECAPSSNPKIASISSTLCWCVDDPPDCEEGDTRAIFCHGQVQPEGTPLYPGCIVSCLSAM